MSRGSRTLADVPGIGPTLAARLTRRNIGTRAQLRRIIGELPLETRVDLRRNPVREIPLGDGTAIAAELSRRLQFCVDGRHAHLPVSTVGSVRRREPRGKDIDLLAVLPRRYRFTTAILATIRLRPARPGDRAALVEVYASGARRLSGIFSWRKGRVRRNYRVDIFLATEKEKPYALFHWTSSAGYAIRIRAHAKRKGWRLNQYGLYNAGTRTRVRGSAGIRSERELARLLGVAYRPPADRLR